MRILRLVPLALALLAGFACARREEPPPPAGLGWTMQDLQRSWSADQADTLPEVWISLHYPEFTDPAAPRAADSLNAWVEQALVAASQTDSTPGDLEALARQMIANYQSLRRDLPGSPVGSWYYENEVLVRWDSLGVLAMVSTADSYLGGAHGNAVRIHAVFDRATGRRLGFGDLFDPAEGAALTAAAEAAFREARRLPEDVRLDRAGFWFEDGRFRLTPNFGLEREGIVLNYNSYDIAPYAMGPTAVRLPWDSVAGLLRADGPLAPLRGR